MEKSIDINSKDFEKNLIKKLLGSKGTLEYYENNEFLKRVGKERFLEKYASTIENKIDIEVIGIDELKYFYEKGYISEDVFRYSYILQYGHNDSWKSFAKENESEEEFYEGLAKYAQENE